jgi:hypothetical protein
MRRGATLDLVPSPRVLLGDAASVASGERRPQRDAAGTRHGERLGEGQRTKRKLDELLAQDRAVDDVRVGRVHPVLYEIERTAQGTFRPSWALVDGDRQKRGAVATSARSWLVGIGRNYLEELRRYREAQSGLPDDESTRTRMLDGYNRLLRIAEENASVMACELCVTVARGELPAARLRRRSGNRVFDRLALESLARAARLREPPAGAHAPRVEACYEFSARFHRVPPTPTLGCSFDESVPTISCYYPFKKILRSNVKLLSARTPVHGG